MSKSMKSSVEKCLVNLIGLSFVANFFANVLVSWNLFGGSGEGLWHYAREVHVIGAMAVLVQLIAGIAILKRNRAALPLSIASLALLSGSTLQAMTYSTGMSSPSAFVGSLFIVLNLGTGMMLYSLKGELEVSNRLARKEAFLAPVRYLRDQASRTHYSTELQNAA